MAELVLYDNPGSSNALKVRVMLAELGLSARTVEVPLADPRPDWYRELHPFGTVPCLVDGDLVLVESNTMLRYLADREGRDDLYPPPGPDRARVDQLLDALSLVLRPALWELEKRTYYATAPVDEAELVAARTDVAAALAGWERLIAPDGYAVGTFSIADIATVARMMLIHEITIDLDPFPRTRRMLEVVGQREAFLSSR